MAYSNEQKEPERTWNGSHETRIYLRSSWDSVNIIMMLLLLANYLPLSDTIMPITLRTMQRSGSFSTPLADLLFWTRRIAILLTMFNPSLIRKHDIFYFRGLWVPVFPRINCPIHWDCKFVVGASESSARTLPESLILLLVSFTSPPPLPLPFTLGLNKYISLE